MELAPGQAAITDDEELKKQADAIKKKAEAEKKKAAAEATKAKATAEVLVKKKAAELKAAQEKAAKIQAEEFKKAQEKAAEELHDIPIEWEDIKIEEDIEKAKDWFKENLGIDFKLKDYDYSKQGDPEWETLGDLEYAILDTNIVGKRLSKLFSDKKLKEIYSHGQDEWNLEISNTPLVKIGDVEGTGLYSNRTGDITLAGRHAEDSGPKKPGSYNISNTLDGVLTHEMGHKTQKDLESKMFSDFKAGLSDRDATIDWGYTVYDATPEKDRTGKLSVYSNVNENEYFAEAFSAKYTKNPHIVLDDRIVNFFNEWLE